VALLGLSAFSLLVGHESRAVAASVTPVRFAELAVAYHPRGFVPGADGRPVSSTQVVADLRLLRAAGFRSLVTYAASDGLSVVPALARREGFNGTIIMGLWDPLSAEEWSQAVDQRAFVDGYCLGNEGLGIRYAPGELATRMSALKASTGRPVTTSERIEEYLEGPYRHWLLERGDWLFPIAHGFLAGESDPQRAVEWTVARYDYLVGESGRAVILKEAGFPTSGANAAGEVFQQRFFRLLTESGVKFFFFEAFDQPWKADRKGQLQVEAHWGVFDKMGRPKPIVAWTSSR
jgi:exo-beta-1,3-glucanase (GH17 family)